MTKPTVRFRGDSADILSRPRKDGEALDEYISRLRRAAIDGDDESRLALDGVLSSATFKAYAKTNGLAATKN